ncbi:hypothetical protein DFH05DRAFT_1589439 [Lentinula detonsa]|uniref:Uncharacterized protein n=1 Tax=Lentinula detonsa TaxID=2804962 RepID=A0A9W8U110_9AGAR|nr:hypothetical protein DFH05DRAFT_1589439 [Lentinula detonsa]
MGFEGEEEGDTLFPLELTPGDEFSDIARVGISLSEERTQGIQEIQSQGGIRGIQEGIQSPGEYIVYWRRILSNTPNHTHPPAPLCSTTFPLPSLTPFPSSSPSSSPSFSPSPEPLTALLTIPRTANLHEPIPMSLLIRNTHPTRTADVYVVVEGVGGGGGGGGGGSGVGGGVGKGDMGIGGSLGTGTSTGLTTTDPSLPPTTTTSPSPPGFTISGLRSGRVPLLLGGTDQRLLWTLVPLECGYVTVPRVRVFDRRGLGGLAKGGLEEEREKGKVREREKGKEEGVGKVGKMGGGQGGAGGAGGIGGIGVVGEGREVRVVDVGLEYWMGKEEEEGGGGGGGGEGQGQGQGKREERIGRIGSVFVLP